MILILFDGLRRQTLRGFFDKLKRDLRRSLAWFSLLVPSGYKLTTLSAAEKHLHKRAVKKARLLYRDQSFKAIAALFRFPKNQDSSSLSSASSLPLFPSRRSRPGALRIKDNRGGVNPPRFKILPRKILAAPSGAPRAAGPRSAAFKTAAACRRPRRCR